MKFAHEYQQRLGEADLPTRWVEIAIAYGRLKKCIKKLQRELVELGLDASTLRTILVPPDVQLDLPLAPEAELPLCQYLFEGDDPHPRLSMIVDTKDGRVVDAGFSAESKEYLRTIVRRRASTSSGVEELGPLNPPSTTALSDEDPNAIGSDVGHESDEIISRCRMIELRASTPPPVGSSRTELVGTQRLIVPLSSDSEFFGLLKLGLSDIDQLRAQEQQEMSEQVAQVGDLIVRATTPSRRTTDLGPWRTIFELYLEGAIFFSTREQDHGVRDAASAGRQLQWFFDEAERRGVRRAFRSRESSAALESFVRLNGRLLRNVTFQELNRTAIVKILKKFNRQTALRAMTTLPHFLEGNPILHGSVAKAICYQLAQDVFSTVPQLTDYLCPVCASIAFKPIRLNCGHFFCIRCMIRMQRAGDAHCPLCRSDVVLGADSANLDPALQNFLAFYFPQETKAKQKENEHAVAVDRWGENPAKCILM
ncbi:MAG: hypothetical protein M1826_006374 [Phylliscum demangeonii]|nr:MAG: hypothetical protein M1826_006374 [Phylliscum demangeonii]